MVVLTDGPNAIVQNQIYALPARRALFFTDATTPTIQQSTDPAFGTNAALTLTNGQAEVAGGFIRCTTGNINCNIKTQA
jgi:hypothetical protein